PLWLVTSLRARRRAAEDGAVVLARGLALFGAPRWTGRLEAQRGFKIAVAQRLVVTASSSAHAGRRVGVFTRRQIVIAARCTVVGTCWAATAAPGCDVERAAIVGTVDRIDAVDAVAVDHGRRHTERARQVAESERAGDRRPEAGLGQSA